MISRRTFLKASVAAASGLILPDWLVKAETFIEMEGEPYLEKPARSETILHAVDWGDGEYRFALGDPREEPPKMTWQEFLDKAGFESLNEFYGSDGPEDNRVDLYDEANFFDPLDWWVRHQSPDVKAFRYLESLNLGPDFGIRDSVGEIRFYDGVSPGNSAIFSAVPDDLSLSLLQKRLNDLGEGVLLEVQSVG